MSNAAVLSIIFQNQGDKGIQGEEYHIYSLNPLI